MQPEIKLNLPEEFIPFLDYIEGDSTETVKIQELYKAIGECEKRNLKRNASSICRPYV